MRTYVGSIDPSTGHRSVVITDREDPPAGGEIGQLLEEITGDSAARSLGRPDPDPARRARVLSRIRAAGLEPEERPLPHRVLHSSEGFAWGFTGRGPADLAYAILQRELVEEVPPEVYLAFRDQVVSRLPVKGFRLPAPDVWAWIRENRALIDEKVFGVVPDQPALAVVDGDPAPDAATTGGEPLPLLPGPTASALVLACESAWGDIRTRHPELPEVVVILGSGVERGRLVKLGHWWGGRWIADGQVRGEVLLAGEALHLEPKQVFEVLLHEAAHGLNAARGVKDTSRGGRYHNEKFAATAREVGLNVRAMPPYGMAGTELTVETEESYGVTIAALGDAMRIARQLDGIKGVGAEETGGTEPGTTGGAEADRSRNAPSSACGCGRKMRMHAGVLAQGPVICGVCGTEFTTGAEVRREVERETGSANVDTSFQARRREAMAAERDRELREGLEIERSVLDSAVDDVSGGREGTAGIFRERRDRVDAAIASLRDGMPGIASDTASRIQHPTNGRLRRWYERYGTADEAPMIALDARDLGELERTARELLRGDGTLCGPDVDLGPLDVAVGDRVILKDPLDGGPPPGTLGSIVSVDPQRVSCTVDFATWGTLEVDRDSEEAAVLAHDYATLGHTEGIEPSLALTVERERAMAMELEP